MDPKSVIRDRLRNSSYRRLADELGTDHAYLYRVVTGEKEASPQLIEALGLERIVTYRKKRSGSKQ